MKKTIVIASGFFNPLHKGHVEYLEKASKLGDELLVIVNTDEQVKIKGSQPFMDLEERLAIVRALKFVDSAIPALDKDVSVRKSIEFIVDCHKSEAEHFPPNGVYNEFIFAKGGDRTSNNIPEEEICDRLGVKIVDGLGKKIQSSSELLNKVKI